MYKNATLLYATQFVLWAWLIFPVDAEKDDVLLNAQISPYEVRIEYYDLTVNEIICSGSIISQQIVLTAASCFDNSWNSPYDLYQLYDQYIIIAGITEESDYYDNSHKYRIQSLVRHPEYNISLSEKYNDIAMVFTYSFIPWNTPTIKAVDLPNSKLNPGDKCLISFWNEDAIERTLVNIPTRPWSHSECAKHIPNIKITQICTPIKDMYSPNRGDPLVCSNALHGIMSLNSQSKINFSICTNVFYYLDWIQKVNSSMDNSAYLNNSAFDIQRSYNVQTGFLTTLSAFLVWV